jgi:hypothetical protein
MNTALKTLLLIILLPFAALALALIGVFFYSLFSVHAVAQSNYVVGPLCCAGQLEHFKAPVYGHGNMPCKTWLDASARPDGAAVYENAFKLILHQSGVSFVQGYYAASFLDWPELRAKSSPTPEAIELWLTSYCAENSTHSLADAAVVMVASIWADRRKP